MAMLVRTKPTNKLLNSTHVASDVEYGCLVSAVVRACIMREKDIFYKVPYFIKFSHDFPKGIKVGSEGIYDTYKTKTVKLTDWLFEKGYCPESHRGIMLSLRDLAYKEAHINSLLKNVKIELDSDKNLWENVDVENKEKTDGQE